jgi:hypothetical protein
MSSPPASLRGAVDTELIGVAIIGTGEAPLNRVDQQSAVDLRQKLSADGDPINNPWIASAERSMMAALGAVAGQHCSATYCR